MLASGALPQTLLGELALTPDPLTKRLAPSALGIYFLTFRLAILAVPVLYIKNLKLYPVVYPYSHQRPWGGERLGGRYTPVERLRRRLRDCRREGRLLGDDTCCGRLVLPISNTVDGWARRSKAAASGRAASITTMCQGVGRAAAVGIQLQTSLL